MFFSNLRNVFYNICDKNLWVCFFFGFWKNFFGIFFFINNLLVINIILFVIFLVKFILWVIIIIVIFEFVKLCIIFKIFCIIFGFNVEVGLLNNIIFGCIVKVWAIVIFCCWFFESWLGNFFVCFKILIFFKSCIVIFFVFIFGYWCI